MLVWWRKLQPAHTVDRTVAGDLHGQFYDLVTLVKKAGPPTSTQYLFLGDYVDRGCFSCEIVFYLFACKIAHPTSFWMLRGNHESRTLTNHYNFKRECMPLVACPP